MGWEWAYDTSGSVLKNSSRERERVLCGALEKNLQFSQFLQSIFLKRTAKVVAVLC
jgi:hypothetical protein